MTTNVEVKTTLKNSEGQVAYVEFNTPYKKNILLSKSNFVKRYPDIKIS